MRHGRAKAARKTLQYFKRTVGLQTKPFLPVLLDGCFLVALFQYKIPPARIGKVLQVREMYNETQELQPLEGIGLFVTQAAVQEMETIRQTLERKKHDKAAVFRQALEFVRSECTILNDDSAENLAPIAKKAKTTANGSTDTDSTDDAAGASPHEALMWHVNDDSRVYVVATQDEGLLDELRGMGTVPIMRLANNSVLLLEQPSRASQRQAMGEERSKWKDSLPAAEKALVELAKEKTKGTTIVDTIKPLARGRKKRKAKGPNPLSCKRKKG